MAIVESKLNHKQAFIHAFTTTGLLLLLSQGINYATGATKSKASDFRVLEQLNFFTRD
jgi:hypothetical protein